MCFVTFWGNVKGVLSYEQKIVIKGPRRAIKQNPFGIPLGFLWDPFEIPLGSLWDVPACEKIPVIRGPQRDVFSYLRGNVKGVLSYEQKTVIKRDPKVQ